MNFQFSLISALLALVAGAPFNTTHVIAVLVHKELVKPFAGNITAGNDTNGTHSLLRRAEYSANATATCWRYWIDYSIAGRPQSAVLDTGSSDTWTYGDGSNQVSGTWALDTISLGGASVPQAQFAYLNQTTPNYPNGRGIFGIGPQAAETEQYTSFLQHLTDSGQIAANAFSLYTNPATYKPWAPGSDGGNSDIAEATLLLGGIDTENFVAPLHTVLMSTGFVSNLYYSVDFSFQGTSYNGGVLDTGAGWIYLPQDVVDPLAAKYGAEWSDDDGNYIFPDGVVPDTASFQPLIFGIGGVQVTLPAENIFNESDGLWVFAFTRSISQLGIQFVILGDPILRQLYLVVDNDSRTVGFAPLVNTTASNLVPIGSSIPDSQRAESSSSGSGSGCVIC